MAVSGSVNLKRVGLLHQTLVTIIAGKFYNGCKIDTTSEHGDSFRKDPAQIRVR